MKYTSLSEKMRKRSTNLIAISMTIALMAILLVLLQIPSFNFKGETQVDTTEQISAQIENSESPLSTAEATLIMRTTTPEGSWDLGNEDNTKWFHVSADSSVTENEQQRDASFKLTFTYELTEDVVHAMDAYEGNPTLIYDLNELVDSSPIKDGISGHGVITVGTRKLGTYTIQDNVVYIVFTDQAYLDGRTSLVGYFALTIKTDEDELGSNDEWEYHFPGTADTITIHYVGTTSEASKGVDSSADQDGNYTLSYTAQIDVNTITDSLKFIDTFGGMQTLDTSSVKLNGSAINVTETANGFEFDVASALGTTEVAKGTYTVTYDTKVTAAQLEAMEEDQDTETNTASWVIDGTDTIPGGETTTTIDKPHENIPVTKKITNGMQARQPGEAIDYKITYGTSQTELAGLRIADYMTDVQTLQGDITLKYGNVTTTIPVEAITADDGRYSKDLVTLFDYTFSDDIQATGPVTVTYTTTLIDAETAKANGIYDTTDITNTAQEKRYDTSSTTHTNVAYEKEKFISVEKVESSSKDADGKWGPGSEITYVLTVGDADTNMAGVNIWDAMTDLQVLQGDIRIKVGDGAEQSLAAYVPGSITYVDDGNYGPNDVELFSFTMPPTAGNGPVVITYTTKIINQEQAAASEIFGNQTVLNIGHGGNGSSGTSGTGIFDEYPIDKKATVNGIDVSNGVVAPGSTMHYTLTFGDETMNMGGVTIFDEMTDMQRVISDITVKKADGSTFTMPTASSSWADNGYAWGYFDDGSYNTSLVRVFNYKLPNNIGNGPITIEYDVQVISEDEVKSAGITSGLVYNLFHMNGHVAQTNPRLDIPSNFRHVAQISKSFDRFDISNDLVYWNIVVEKTSDSAYPIENVVLGEKFDDIRITEHNQGYYNDMGTHTLTGTDFDLANAVITTDNGVILTPGVDYTIDKDNAKITFPTLRERVHINFAFKSPAKIIDGYKIQNAALLDSPWQKATANAEYRNPGITVLKDGNYSEDDRIIEWEVQINPTKAEFTDSDPVSVLFEDTIPEGLTLLNYETGAAGNPTVHVETEGPPWFTYDRDAEYDSATGSVTAQIAAPRSWSDSSPGYGLNRLKYTVRYKTKISDEAWDELTSSATGTREYDNHVAITAGNNETFEADGKVNVTSEEFIVKTDVTQEDANGIVIDEYGNETKTISYTIEINPRGYALNMGKTLTLTDRLETNMDLDTSTVRLVKIEPNGTESEVSGIGISYNDDSRLLSLTGIPDRTHFRLTYSCNARAQGEDTFKNTATIIGGGSHSSSTAEDHKIQTNNAGVFVDSIETYLHKIDENDLQKDLEGAQFQLYECKLAIGDLTNSELYPQSYWDNLLSIMDNGEADANNIANDFKIVEYVPIGLPMASSHDGYTQWTGLSEHKLYAWREVEAPEGYTCNDSYHYFVGYQHLDVNTDVVPQPLLSEEEQLNRKHAAWALDDAAQYANGIRIASMANLTTWTATNIKGEFTSISATKVWEGDSDNLFDTRPDNGITLQLYRINADGTKTAIGDPVAVNAGPDGEWPSHIWSKLPTQDNAGNTLKYTVEEARVPNYSTTYSDDGEGIETGTITVTNKMIPKNTSINVKKEFGADVPDSAKPTQVIIELLVIKTDKDGNASEPEPTGFSQALSATNDWQAKFSSLPTMTVENGNAYTLTYTVRESSESSSGFTVTYSDNQQGVIEASADDPLVVTNKTRSGNLKVNKSISGVQLTDAQKQAITFTVKNSQGNKVAEFTLAAMGNDLSYTINDLPEGIYTVTETVADESMPAGYTLTTTYSVANGKTNIVTGNTSEVTVINTYTEETTSATVRKIWEDSSNQDGKRPASIQVQLQADNENVGEPVVLNSANNWAATIENLPKYNNGQEISYTWIETGIPAGYALDDTTVDDTITTLTNVHTPEKTTASVEKKWEDGNNRDNKRPDSVRVQLLANGTESGEPVVLSAANEWKYTWTDLDKYASGAKISYTIKEMSVDDYTTEIVKDDENKFNFTITNTHVPETTDIDVIKIWNDNDNQDRVRPEAITVNLMAGTDVIDTQTLNAANNWYYKWTGLAKNEAGSPIAYSVKEAVVPDHYSASVSNQAGRYTLTNTLIPQTTEVEALKDWDDNDNQDGVRPDSITWQLKANGEDYGDPVTVTVADEWKHKWENLPLNAGGNPITYTVVEIGSVAPYAMTESGDAGNNYTVKNSYTPGTTSVAVAKIWNDFDNRDNVRPAFILVQLKENGQDKGEAVALNVENSWTYTWANLPEKKNGQTITYTVDEVDVPAGYTKVVTGTVSEGFTITNSHEKETTEISVEKKWEDANNQDGKRPETIQVQLKADGENCGVPITLNEGNRWKYTWTDLDKNKAGAVGQAIVYTVDEVAVPTGYTKVNVVGNATSGFTITNRHTPEKISIPVTKVWDDKDNQDGMRPENITVQLKIGDEIIQSANLNQGNDWSAEFKNLPKYANGSLIDYTVVEVGLPDGYRQTEASGSIESGFTFKNTHDVQKTEISVEKIWEDADNQDGKRPTSIEVQLYANGTPKDAPIALNETNEWQYTWTDLDANVAGSSITYTVDEVEVPTGYTKDPVTGDAANGFTITNRHVPEKIEITGSKSWDDSDNEYGNRPETITLQLMKNGVAEGSPVVVGEAQDWSHTWENLDKYAGAEEIVYMVAELDVPEGYSATPGTKGNNYTVTNTPTPKTTVTVLKNWEDANDQDGKRPGTIQVQLKAGNANIGEPISLSGANNWTYTWTGLEKFVGDQEIVYSVEELALPEDLGYEYGTVQQGPNNTFTFTNSRSPEKTAVHVQKRWDDNNNQDGIRPETVSVTLLKNGNPESTVELNEENSWSYDWTDLPVYANGQPITYSLQEITTVPGYEETTVGLLHGVYVIVNKHTPETTTAGVQKIWVDDNDRDGLRPDSITVQLKADGEEYGEAVVLNASNTWSYEWSDLPKKANGNLITYTVEESGSINGYELISTEKVSDGHYKLTNKHDIITTEKTVKKVWDDNNNQDGKRNDDTKVTVQLYNNDGPYGNPIELDKENNWTYTWTALPVNCKGSPANYSVVETDKPADYTPTVTDGTEADGTDFVVTNSYTPGVVDHTVEKVWSDSDNQDNIRPESIQVQLYADNVAQGDVVTLDAEHGWTYTWTGLAAKKAGQDIVYTVDEISVPTGYAKSVSETSTTYTTITNSHTPEVVPVTVEKIWDDNNNQDGMRPDKITVNLLDDNNAVVRTAELKENNNWKVTWTGLPKYAAGSEIAYRVEESGELSGYVLSSSIGTVASGFKLTNKHDVDKTNIKVTKKWTDADDQDGIRPDRISVQLYADNIAHGGAVVLDAEHNWTYTWTDLDAKKAGQDIVYTVQETAVPSGYELVGVTGNANDGYVIENKHVTAETQITGTKVWNDANNQDGKRPEKISLQLKANDEALGNAVEVGTAENWTHTWTKLPKYANGELIRYTVSESRVEDYSTTSSTDAETGNVTITNSYTPGETNISVSKIWNDGNNQDGMRPNKINVQLLANGTAFGDAIELNQDNNWSYTWEKLPEKASGATISYTVQELDEITGYTTSYGGNANDGYTITNTHVPATVKVSVAKVWNDDDNRDKMRPADIQVQLLANDIAYGEVVTLNADNNWRYTWSDLPKLNQGNAISYTLAEVAIPNGYTSTQTHEQDDHGNMTFTLNNSHTPETTGISVTKVWEDGGNRDLSRPEKVSVTLKANGVNVETVDLDAEHGWAYHWTGLNKNENGQAITYTVEETVPNGYEASYSGDAENGYTITNAYNYEKTSASVTKVWNDGDNRDLTRTDHVTVQLSSAEGVVGTVELSAGNGWSYTWNDLPANYNGEKLIYVVTELDVPDDYTVACSDDENNFNFTLTNSYMPDTTSISVTKIWQDGDNQDGLRPKNGISVQLLADNQPEGEAVILNGSNGWSHTWTSLPKRNAGTEIAYTIAEIGDIQGYTTTYNGNAEQGYSIINAHTPEVIDIPVAKIWNDDDNRDGVRPNGAKVTLYADGSPLADHTVVVGDGANWSYSFTGLPKYRDEGVEIVYTLEETNVSDEYSPASETVEGVTTFTNTHEPEKIQISGIKTWDDSNNANGYRPESITVCLLADGTKIDSATIGEADGWSYSFEGLNKYRDRGVPIVYTIVEEAVDGYIAAYTKTTNGYNITNELNLGQLVVSKEVVGTASSKTFEFTVTLGDNNINGTYKDMTFENGVAHLTLAGGESAEATGLPAGTTYVVAEAESPNYIASATGERGTIAKGETSTAAFTNTYSAKTTFALEATKVMKGRTFKTGDKFTFTVEGSDGAPMPVKNAVTIEPTEGNEASVNFGNIEFTENDLGKTYTYTVHEASAPEDAKGVTNDPFAHVVTIKIDEDDDGNLICKPKYDNNAPAMIFTNTYSASGQAQLFAKKTLDGRKLADNEFFFTLEGDGLDVSRHAGANAEGIAEFEPIEYTLTDAGKDFTYKITEDQGALPGITYDNSEQTVTVHVEDNGDGTLAITYNGQNTYAGAAFANTYTTSDASVVLEARKVLAGADMVEGQFSFVLSGISENAKNTNQTVSNATDGTVTFNEITYNKPGEYKYTISEVIPEGATNNGDGTYTAGTIVYDGMAHEVVVNVEDNGRGALVATVSYDGNQSLTITNSIRKFALTSFTFDKYYFGGTGVFNFSLVASNADGSARTGEAVEFDQSKAIIDDGNTAFTIKAQNGTFTNGKAEVHFPTINYAQDGDYYYLAYEDEQDTSNMITDKAQYLIHVSVADGKIKDVVYELVYEGQNLGETDDHSFYNNSTVKFGFDSLSAQGYTDLDERVSVYPQTKKLLNDSTDMLVGGEFSFELVDSETGTVLAVGTNDENGQIAFFDENVDPGLVYDEPGVYNYIIREVVGNDASIIYDKCQISLAVTVTQTDEGLVAETAYNGPGGADPAFHNIKEGMDVVVQKVSRFGGEGLLGSTYQLWMVGVNGDIPIQEATSDAYGYITFTNVSLMKGHKYYFKEFAAPEGHTVDPYRTAYFSLNDAGDELVLVEETAPDGWHSAGYKD